MFSHVFGSCSERENPKIGSSSSSSCPTFVPLSSISDEIFPLLLESTTHVKLGFPLAAFHLDLLFFLRVVVFLWWFFPNFTFHTAEESFSLLFWELEPEKHNFFRLKGLSKKNSRGAAAAKKSRNLPFTFVVVLQGKHPNLITISIELSTLAFRERGAAAAAFQLS